MGPEAALQGSEVQLGHFRSPTPISKQETSLTVDDSDFTVSCLHPVQGEIQREVDSADYSPRESHRGGTPPVLPAQPQGPFSLFSVFLRHLLHILSSQIQRV